jgi:hypothetical protein
VALIVQNDNGTVTGANSYQTLAEFKAYHDTRGNSYAAAANDTAIEHALIKATDYLDQRFYFVGERAYGREQETEWPRVRAFDRDRYPVNGIPLEIKEATAEYALRAITADLNPDPDYDTTGQAIASKSETVGPITESVTYAGGGGVVMMPKYPAADQKLYKTGLVRDGGEVRRG